MEHGSGGTGKVDDIADSELLVSDILNSPRTARSCQ